MLLRIHKLYPVMEWREGPAFFEMLYDLSCKSANTEEAYNNYYFFKTYSNFTELSSNDSSSSSSLYFLTREKIHISCHNI